MGKKETERDKERKKGGRKERQEGVGKKGRVE